MLSLIFIELAAILITALLFIRHQRLTRRTHLAVRAWYEQQLALSAHDVNFIRDDALQELSAVRRGLELTAASHFGPQADSGQYRTWIRQLESLHLALNELVDSLVPPFVTDSLPLALATHLKAVKGTQAGFKFSLRQSGAWEPREPLSASKAILTFFQELERGIIFSGEITSIDLDFTQTGRHKCLAVKLTPVTVGGPTDQKVHDLGRMINFLSAVECQMFTKDRDLLLTFRWDGYQKQ